MFFQQIDPLKIQLLFCFLYELVMILISYQPFLIFKNEGLQYKLIIQTNISQFMRKYQGIKKIDLKQENANKINFSEKRNSFQKNYSYSRSSKYSIKDISENHGYQTDRYRQSINQFNLLLGQSPHRSIPEKKSIQKGSIKTYVRFKPICKSDLLQKQSVINLKQANHNKLKASVQISDDKFMKYQIYDQKTVNISINQETSQTYSFDKIFPPDSTQTTVYDQTTKQLVDKFIDGFNTTIFAYGQTGSGKTFTMLGDSSQICTIQNKGLILRALQQIFNKLPSQSFINKKTKSVVCSNATSPKSSVMNLYTSPQKQSKGQQGILSCSLLEIYKQNLIDLFSNSQNQTQLKIKQSNNGIQIDGLTVYPIYTIDSAMKLLEKGIQMRKTRSTDINDRSSRSHLIFTLYFKNKVSDNSYRISKFNLVDLAGSQKVSKTKVNGEGLQQAKKINLSLSCLGNTINALSKNHDHIPFRDSKLTRILQQSLSGNSITRVIITCSIIQMCKQQTVSSLKFGHRLKKIKLQQSQNACKSISDNNNMINKYVYDTLLSSYQQSQSKLVKIKQIVNLNKDIQTDNQQFIQELIKVFDRNQNQQIDNKDNILTNPQVKISKSQCLSVNNQSQVLIESSKQHANNGQLNTLKYNELLILLQQKQQQLKQKQAEIIELKKNQNLLQKPKYQNKLKIAKPSKAKRVQNNHINNDKNTLKQKQLNLMGVNSGKTDYNEKYVYQSDIKIKKQYQVFQELKKLIEDLISYRNSFYALQKDILTQQLKLLINEKVLQQESAQIRKLIVFNEQYVCKIQKILYQQLPVIKQILHNFMQNMNQQYSPNDEKKLTTIRSQIFLKQPTSNEL